MSCRVIFLERGIPFVSSRSMGHVSLWSGSAAVMLSYILQSNGIVAVVSLTAVQYVRRMCIGSCSFMCDRYNAQIMAAAIISLSSACGNVLCRAVASGLAMALAFCSLVSSFNRMAGLSASASIGYLYRTILPLDSDAGTSIMRWLLLPRNGSDSSRSAITKRPSTSTSMWLSRVAMRGVAFICSNVNPL